jgi:signal transduction histidine kinase
VTALAVMGRESVSRKFLLVVLTATVSALMITGISLVFYDVHTSRRAWVDDLSTQAEILGLASAPALDFADPASAQEYLALLQAKPNIAQAAIYTAGGKLFASYTRQLTPAVPFPQIPSVDGYTFDGDRLTLFSRIVQNDEILGTVFLQAEYGILARLLDYLGIVGTVLGISLIAALLLSRRLQQTITRPIYELTSAARKVVDQRDFGIRVDKTTTDEIGLLVDAFNEMLAEIGTRTAYLESSKKQLEETEERLRSLNAELEARVSARTEELETANKDLEGFSYSVSHDLRAPIRAISGFCTLFEQDHRSQLDDESRRKLGIIKSEADRMGALIDDLLAFSRLGRKAIARSELDMAELVNSVLSRLKSDGETKPADVRIGVLPRASADRSLIEQVWTNLLSNAFKFSSKAASPTIEIGGISDEKEHVYFIRDNGTGFDPKYAERLFGVFQRLHQDTEYPGTGVGLALVQKIVTRHGGRVWADGRPGDGATFHFTLPKEC